MKKSKSLVVVLILALILGAVPSSFGVQKVLAEKSTREQIKDKQKEKEQIKDKIDDQKEDIKDLKGDKRDLQDEMAEANERMLDAVANLVDIENQIKVKNQEIEDNLAALDAAIAREEKQKEDMEIRVRKMYERNSADYVTSLMSAGSLGKLLNLATWFERVETYDKDRLSDFERQHATIEQLEADLEQQKADLDDLHAQAEAERARVAGVLNTLVTKIDDYSDQISDAEKKALEYEAELKKNEEDLKALQKKLEEELRISREAAQGKWRSISDVTFTEADRKLLANIIYCEAGGEPYEGKLAVGAVVINRVLSSKFPDTVAGVIYAKSQFSPVASGRFELALATDKATSACYQAADEAMLGVTNVGVCVYFRTPIPGLVGINIGGHVFY
ncbi:MAG: cell wall hydrolase [Lachnospiraceae bacterium]|nr:cell wall hydrolase [Lachnospiraceae bacterium]MBQ3907223.1 cell wall hydrolase [Lachnospiraceae bacterium]